MDRGELALLFLARAHHPNAATRSRVDDLLRGPWARPDIAAASGAAVAAALRAERGTVIEPFLLDSGDEPEALRVADTVLARGGAIQVVSRDKLEPEGGLVLAGGGADVPLLSAYAERRADRRPADPPDAVRYSPGHRPDHRDVAAGADRPAATLHADDAGLRVELEPPPSFGPGTGDPRLATWSVGEGLPHRPRMQLWGALGDAGGRPALTLAPRTPEEVLRFSSLLEGGWLVAHERWGPHPGVRLAVRLEAPSGQPVRLTTVSPIARVQADMLAAWIDTPPAFGGPAVTAEVARAVADWVGVAPRWLTDELLLEYA